MWSLTLPQLALACLPLAFSLCQGVLGPRFVGSKAGGLEERAQGRSLEQLLGQKERALRAAQQGPAALCHVLRVMFLSWRPWPQAPSLALVSLFQLHPAARVCFPWSGMGSRGAGSVRLGFFRRPLPGTLGRACPGNRTVLSLLPASFSTPRQDTQDPAEGSELCKQSWGWDRGPNLTLPLCPEPQLGESR